MFLLMASYIIRQRTPKELTLSSSGPQHLRSWAHPYFPPGIALDIDLGGFIYPFLVFFFWA